MKRQKRFHQLIMFFVLLTFSTYAQQKSIYQLMSSNGDGSGIVDAIGDYSTTPMALKISSSEAEIVEIHRLIVGIQDTGAFDAAKYGNGIALDVGINLYLKDSNGDIIETYTPQAVKTNAGWAFLCHDYNHFSFGTGDEVGTVRWTFDKSGQPIYINFGAGQYLEAVLDGDFSGLNHHFFTIEGKYKDEDI